MTSILTRLESELFCWWENTHPSLCGCHLIKPEEIPISCLPENLKARQRVSYAFVKFHDVREKVVKGHWFKYRWGLYLKPSDPHFILFSFFFATHNVKILWRRENINQEKKKRKIKMLSVLGGSDDAAVLSRVSGSHWVTPDSLGLRDVRTHPQTATSCLLLPHLLACSVQTLAAIGACRPCVCRQCGHSSTPQVIRFWQQKKVQRQYPKYKCVYFLR